MWITAAFRFFTGKVGRWVGIALIVAASIGWLRWDAAQDARRGIEADSNAAWLEHRETSEKEKSDVESIFADDLERELIERLSREHTDN